MFVAGHYHQWCSEVLWVLAYRTANPLVHHRIFAPVDSQR